MRVLIAMFSFLVFEAIFAAILYLAFSFVTWDINWVINNDEFARFIFIAIFTAWVTGTFSSALDFVKFINNRFY